MNYLDVFFLSDPGDIKCQGKVWVQEGGYWHVLITEEEEKGLPRGYLKFSELPMKRAGGRAFHTFSGYLERLEGKDGGFDDREGK